MFFKKRIFKQRRLRSKVNKQINASLDPPIEILFLLFGTNIRNVGSGIRYQDDQEGAVDAGGP